MQTNKKNFFLSDVIKQKYKNSMNWNSRGAHLETNPDVFRASTPYHFPPPSNTSPTFPDHSSLHPQYLHSIHPFYIISNIHDMQKKKKP